MIFTNSYADREGIEKKEHFIDLFPTSIITPNDVSRGRRDERGGGATTRDESGRWTMQGERVESDEGATRCRRTATEVRGEETAYCN
jgi:hypothetical protein